MTLECPSCHEESDTEYRCEHCGKVLAKVTSSSSGDRAVVGGGE